MEMRNKLKTSRVCVKIYEIATRHERLGCSMTKMLSWHSVLDLDKQPRRCHRVQEQFPLRQDDRFVDSDKTLALSEHVGLSRTTTLNRPLLQPQGQQRHSKNSGNYFRQLSHDRDRCGVTTESTFYTLLSHKYASLFPPTRSSIKNSPMSTHSLSRARSLLGLGSNRLSAMTIVLACIASLLAGPPCYKIN